MKFCPKGPSGTNHGHRCLPSYPLCTPLYFSSRIGFRILTALSSFIDFCQFSLSATENDPEQKNYVQYVQFSFIYSPPACHIHSNILPGTAVEWKIKVIQACTLYRKVAFFAAGCTPTSLGTVTHTQESPPHKQFLV